MGLRRWKYRDKIEAGCDEAGRGCLAGPVVAASVILDPARPINGLNDSKLLSPKKRNTLRKRIEDKALGWAVCMVDPAEIDRINILQASCRGMLKAINQLNTPPDLLLIDGNYFTPHPQIPHKCIIRGDSQFQSIAAASILAKTHRDQYMEEMHAHFPNYGWQRNKGYATLEHRKAIDEFGYSPQHRKSFRKAREQPQLFNPT